MEVDEVLAQFGCMQTQDKEELVNQMLRLVGTNMNYTTARFYLEMNQWNVQAAVCSYFDLETVNSSLPGWLVGSVGSGFWWVLDDIIPFRFGFEETLHLY